MLSICAKRRVAWGRMSVISVKNLINKQYMSAINLNFSIDLHPAIVENGFVFQRGEQIADFGSDHKACAALQAAGYRCGGVRLPSTARNTYSASRSVCAGLRKIIKIMI